MLAEGLRREAHEDWDIDRLAWQFGEVLHKGDVYTLGLLDLPAPNVTLAGPGVQHIQTELLNDGRTASGLKIIVVNSVVGQELPFEVTVVYGGGASETIKFVIVEPWRVHLPLLASGSAGATTAQAVAPSENRRSVCRLDVERRHPPQPRLRTLHQHLWEVVWNPQWSLPE